MNKIKAIDPKIIVNRDVDRPYYSIEYYDTSDNQWHIGYGSYNLENVVGWLDTDFDVVEADVSPVKHGHWILLRESEITGFNPEFAGRDPIGGYQCSNCKEEAIFDCNDEFVLSSYCPNCGAKMDGGEGE